MKQRFDGLDVTAMVAHVRSTMTGRRVVNVYDGDSGESYVVKLDAGFGGISGNGGDKDGKDGDDSSSNKGYLLVESGIRFHPLRHFSAASGGAGGASGGGGMPSPFCSKLRKHLRGLRLEQISQVGTDRVVLMHFGVGQGRHTLILELYARGNLILTDREFKILALLRSHVYNSNGSSSGKQQSNSIDNQIGGTGSGKGPLQEEGKEDAPAAAAADGHRQEENVAVQVGHAYPVAYATTVAKEPSPAAGPAGGGDGGNDSEDGGAAAAAAATGILGEKYMEWIDQAQQDSMANNAENGGTATKKKKKKQKPATLKTLLLKPDSGVYQYGPALIEHCVLVAGLQPHEPLAGYELDGSQWERLRTTLREDGQRILGEVGTGDGYILYDEAEQPSKPETGDGGGAAAVDSDLPHADKMLQEFFPYLFLQHAQKPVLKYDSFGAAVADFYSQLSRQKQIVRARAAEAAARQKLEKVRVDQELRLEALGREQLRLKGEALATQRNAGDVDKALIVVNSALSSGLDWEDLERLVEVEQQKLNPIAMLIRELDLEKDAMILRLPVDPVGTGEGEEEANPYLDVRISLKESAHGNANALFARNRASKEKAAKTIEASSAALKAAEENAMRQLEEAQKRTKMAPLAKRKPAWYEKFHWFVTSDNYLVLGGKDAHQNEQLVKRYLRPGDAYLHADVHGAASCILRAKRRRTGSGRTVTVPLSEQALKEAGHFTICRSSAWSSRMVTSAWWVEADQVSKTAPTGEYLSVGSFMVRGKKNFLPPSQLEMGLAVLFRLGDDDSIARHKNDRRDFALIALESSLEDEDEPGRKRYGSATQKSASQSNHEKTTSTPVDALEKEAEGVSATDETPESGFRNEQSQKEKDECSSEETSSEAAPTVGDEVSENKKAQPQKKKGLSARDRRLIKKYGSLEESERILASKKQEKNGGKDKKGSQSSGNNNSNEPNPQGMKRGKKAKMKRAMRKYGDQDEEDRELAMLALQGGEKEKKAERQGETITETQRKVALETNALLVKDASETAEHLSDAVRSILAECVTVKKSDEDEDEVRWDKFDADTLEQMGKLEPEEAQVEAAKRLLHLKSTTRIDNFSASLSGILRTVRKYGHENLNAESNEAPGDSAKRKTKQEKAAEESKWKEALAKEGVVDSDNEDDAVDDTIELNKLTGKPHPDDLVLWAVPICAPYQTLSQYSYRVKLTPGNMKRGKAAKQCTEMLLKGDNAKSFAAKDRDNEIVKKIGDNDWVNAICSDVKISAPGASKAVKKQKAKSKKGKK